MASLREGSRGEEVTAMGGWQWGSGMALPALRTLGCEGGWEDNGGGMDSRFGLCGGRSLRGGTGMGPRIREDNGWGVGSRFRLCGGTLSAGGTGMGPRIREDNGWGMDSRFRLCEGTLSVGGRGWVPASARTTGGGAFVFGGRIWVPAPRLRREDNGGLGQGDGRFANRPYGRRILSGTGFTPIPRLHEGRL